MLIDGIKKNDEMRIHYKWHHSMVETLQPYGLGENKIFVYIYIYI
jgi:hypothetical protein